MVMVCPQWVVRVVEPSLALWVRWRWPRVLSWWWCTHKAPVLVVLEGPSG
jgi:hypothetical protein